MNRKTVFKFILSGLCILGILIDSAAFSSNKKINTGQRVHGFDQKPPEVPLKFSPGVVSTDDHIEFGCTFNRDMDEFYFSRVGGTLGHNYEILCCRYENGKFSDSEPVGINSKYLENEPHISVDNKYIYFNSTRPADGQTSKFNIWRSSRSGNSWTDPVWFRPGMYLTTARSGNLYYTKISDPNDGGIIVYDLHDNGSYKKGVVINGEMNSTFPDAHPYIDPDEQFIIFDSNRPGGFTKSDIYICYKISNDSWSHAINLGKEINSEGDTGFASISPDGKILFFSLGGNIYWVSTKIIDQLKPE